MLWKRGYAWSQRSFFSYEQPAYAVKLIYVILYALFFHKYSFILVPKYCTCNQCLIRCFASWSAVFLHHLEFLFLTQSVTEMIVSEKKCSTANKVFGTCSKGNFPVPVIIDWTKCDHMVQVMERLRPGGHSPYLTWAHVMWGGTRMLSHHVISCELLAPGSWGR